MTSHAYALFFVFAFLQALAITSGLKDCMEQFVSLQRIITCSFDSAFVPQKICHNTDEGCQRAQLEGSEACAVVVEALFAEWRMMDGAFLTSGTCQRSIESGQFCADGALQLVTSTTERGASWRSRAWT